MATVQTLMNTKHRPVPMSQWHECTNDPEGKLFTPHFHDCILWCVSVGRCRWSMCGRVYSCIVQLIIASAGFSNHERLMFKSTLVRNSNQAISLKTQSEYRQTNGNSRMIESPNFFVSSFWGATSHRYVSAVSNLLLAPSSTAFSCDIAQSTFSQVEHIHKSRPIFRQYTTTYRSKETYCIVSLLYSICMRFR